MAGRPRLPANVLDARGAFRKNPKRRRIDALGAAPFKTEPPGHLHPAQFQAWHYLVERLPRIALSSSDEIAVEIAAGLLTRYWATQDLDTIKELRNLAGKTRHVAAGPHPPTGAGPEAIKSL